MVTINISLPERLKEESEKLVKVGMYASFSDLVRDSLRNTISKNKYDVWANEAEQDLKDGKGTVLKNKKQIADFFDSL